MSLKVPALNRTSTLLSCSKAEDASKVCQADRLGGDDVDTKAHSEMILHMPGRQLLVSLRTCCLIV